MNRWIIADAGVLGGKPCIRGTRISVEHILELMASGALPTDVLAAWPQLTPEGLRAALEYASRALRNEVVWEVRVPA